MRQPRILIISSTKHSRATCVNWTDPFPNVEEYDVVILDMPSLDQPSFDFIVGQQPDKFKALQEETKTLLRTTRSVYCIFAKMLTPSAKQVNIKTSRPNSHDCLPLSLALNRMKPGSSRKILDSSFERYFQGLGEWNYEVGFGSHWVNWQNDPIAENKSGKWIAAKSYGDGVFYLLPPLDKCSQEEEIELLIDIVLGEKKEAEYPWIGRIGIPGLPEIQKEIDECEERIQEINKKREETQERYSDRESYRNLFSPNDGFQVSAVKRILSDFGINSNLTKPGFVVDLLGEEVAVEVTSDSGKITTKNDSLTQASRFIQTERKTEKVILIANTYSRLPIEERKGKEDFTPQAGEFLQKLDVCYLTARSLYLMWKLVQQKTVLSERMRQLILRTSGEVTEKAISELS